jgi:hypothetical protein
MDGFLGVFAPAAKYAELAAARKSLHNMTNKLHRPRKCKN